MTTDSVDLERALRQDVEGEVRFDAGTQAMYATDASNYRQVPIGVVIPKSVEDVVRTVAICRRYGAPVLSRGGGTSLAGQCCNVAVVIDWSKYMNKILEVDERERWARVLPGTVCDQLQQEANRVNLEWGPAPATHSHCCFGGMISNNSCGVHAQWAGKADDNLLEAEVLLYDGTRMKLGWTTDAETDAVIRQGGRVGEVRRSLRDLRQRYGQLIADKYPKIPRRVSGYNLDRLLPDVESGRYNLARAICGSEGTLATILELKVRLLEARPQRVLVVLGYSDVYRAGDHVMDIVPFEPMGLEGIDWQLRENVEKKGGRKRRYLPLLPEGRGWLLVEFGADRKEDAVEQAHRMMDAVKRAGDSPSMKLLESTEEQQKIWEIRESGVSATAFVPGEPDTWPGWEDSACPPEKVGEYLRDLRALFSKYGYTAALYGHFGQGCIHCRVNFDLMSADGIKHMRGFLEAATDLVLAYGGSFSGEHGDGQARAEFLPKLFGPELMGAFREFKAIWDPDEKMNPGKLVEAYRFDENLKFGPNYHPREPVTHFKFPEDQGRFARALMRCAGVGKCRRHDSQRPENDTMCPSYMVTGEEKHTTRGRAHQLWEMLNGDVIKKGWRDESVKDALDLCLSCKGCKGDCPVNVDMATYKAEFLSHYWEGRLRPRYAYAFGLIDRWARLASITPGMANVFTQLPGLRALAKLAAGMPQRRAIPAFAPQTFQAWFRARPRQNEGNERVVLWPDTFNNYFVPETAKAAVTVLEHAGYEVIVPEDHVCCGRPLYEYGFLDRAKRYLLRDVDILLPYIERGAAVIALEPSCCAVFRDELIGLFPDDPRARMVANHTLTLSEFLEHKATHYTLPALQRDAIVQGHCHHKAIMHFDAEEAVMKKMGLRPRVLSSGCCGMAGSFGYEADKYAVSIACGERKLLPEVRNAGLSTLIIADGFSCKEQIAQSTNRHALHLAEVIALAIREGPYGPPRRPS